jgi:hypothetical protein
VLVLVESKSRSSGVFEVPGSVEAVGTALAVKALETVAKELGVVEVVCASTANQVFSTERL